MITRARKHGFFLFVLGSWALHAMHAKVQKGGPAGNELAWRSALLLFYSISLGCRFLPEQPSGSTARYHPRVSQVFDQQTVHETCVGRGLGR